MWTVPSVTTGTDYQLVRACVAAKGTSYSAVDVIEALGQPRRLDPLGFIETYYPQIRRYAPALLEQFDFQAAPGGEDVLAAIDLLRRMNATGKRKLPENAPSRETGVELTE